MVAQRDDFIKLPVPIGGGKHVVFLSHLLPPQPRLEEAAGSGTGEVLANEGILGEGGKGLLCQEDLAAGTLHDPGENAAILLQLCPVDDIAGGGNGE